jgi:hypothetical protein
MKHMKVTKLKLAPKALRQLDDLRLSQGDLHLILCFGRRLKRAAIALRIFEADCLSPNKRLERLSGITLILADDLIVEVCANLNEAEQRSKQYEH